MRLADERGDAGDICEWHVGAVPVGARLDGGRRAASGSAKSCRNRHVCSVLICLLDVRLRSGLVPFMWTSPKRMFATV